MKVFVFKVPVFRRRPPRVRIRMMFFFPAWISFSVSSRRIRICARIERTPPISLSEACHEDILTVQATMGGIFRLKRLTCRFYRWNRSFQVEESVSEHAELNAVFRSRIGLTVFELWKIFLSSWTCHEGRHSNCCALGREKYKGLSSIRWDFVSNCIPYTFCIFCGREHHRGEFSRRIDEHIRESVQRYAVREWQRRHRDDEAYVQLTFTCSIEQNGKRRWSVHAHTSMIDQWIDTHGYKEKPP
jgi:hypothetical protein